MKENNFIFYDYAVIRSPLFSLDFLKKILESNEDWVEETLNNRALLLSILISSPNFHNEVLNYSSYDKEKQHKIKITLLKYIKRATSRCIPFGLFSGVGILQIGNNNSDNVDIKNFRAQSKLDSSFIYGIIKNLKNNNNFLFNLKYFSNNTLYESGDGELRYIDFSSSENGIINFSCSEIEQEDILNKIIELFFIGNTLSFGIDFLQNIGYSKDDSVEFITSLVENNVLISEIEYNSVSNATIEKHILTILARILKENKDAELELYYELLNNLVKKMENICEKDYDELKKIHSEHKNRLLLNVDSFLSSDSYFPSQLLRQLRSGINVLNAIIAQNSIDFNQRIDTFKNEFINRYEYAPQPLLEVLDVENGIGYGHLLNSGGTDKNPLTEKNPLLKEEVEHLKNIKWTLFDSFIIRSIEDANKKNQNIEINDQQINSLSTLERRIRSSEGSIRFSLYKEKHSKEPIIHLKHLAFTSLNKILGRFTHNDQKIEIFSKHITDKSNDSVIYADVNHLVNLSMGNFLYRKSSTEYVIDLIGNVEGYKKIELKDLFIIVIGEKISLYSKNLNKVVIPIFSNAYNYDYPISSPLFKFLLDIHSQYETNELGEIDTKKYLNFFKKIPRIQYKNIILSPETWIVHINNFFNPKKDFNEATNNFLNNTNKLKIDRYFQIIDGDIEQVIDSHNSYSVSIFLNELKKKKVLILSEFLPFKYDNYVSLGNQQITNDFFIPLHFPSNKLTFNIKNIKTHNLNQLYIPGSDCLYYKIYTGVKNADNLLLKIYKNLSKLVSKGSVKYFFFIKFEEKKHHIRLRIFTKHHKDVIDTLYKILLEDIKYKRISSVEIDSYNREIVRYDYENIFYFEQIFYYDSILSIKLIDLYSKKDISNRWLYSMPVIDILCDVFNLSIEQKIAFSKQMILSYSNEFNAKTDFWKFANDKFSVFQNDIIGILQSYKKNPIYNDFYEQLVSLIKHIFSEDESKNFNSISNIFHMHLTRTLGIKNNRISEFMIYEFYKKCLSEK